MAIGFETGKAARDGNYWFLVRKHLALAERYGLRETDVF
jgi:hypothetical protein